MSSAPRGDRKPVTLTKLHEMRALGEPIVMITAYDHPSAVVVEEAGVDIVLVGDSAANTVLGYESTVPGDGRRAADARRRGAARARDAAAGRRPAVRLLRGLGRAGDRHRPPLRQGGGLRRRQARGRRGDGRARPRDRACRRAGHGPRRSHAADGHRARRLPRPGPHGRARAPGARRRARPPGRGLLRDRLRGHPRRGDRRDHGAHGDPGDRDRRRAEHRRPGARAARPARHPRRLPAQVRQALRRREGGYEDRRGGLRGRGAPAGVPARRAHVRHRARRSSSASRSSSRRTARWRKQPLHIHWPADGPAVPALRAQGARVLRPVRGGGGEHRPRHRAARDDARAVARPRRAGPRDPRAASRRATASRTTSSSG